MIQNHFNELTEAQAERLAVLLEEMGELQQAIGKIFRHGYNSCNPDVENHKGNRHDFSIECADVICAIQHCESENDLIHKVLNDRHSVRPEKIKKYLHHN